MGKKKKEPPLATHNTNLMYVDETEWEGVDLGWGWGAVGLRHSFKALIELPLQLLRLIVAVVRLSVAYGALEWSCMLLLSRVFKPSGPERERDHRRSMANLSLFHRPWLILLICLPFVEAHSQFPEFRIKPCFVTKTAQVITLNGRTVEKCACELVHTHECVCVYLTSIRWVYAQIVVFF